MGTNRVNRDDQPIYIHRAAPTDSCAYSWTQRSKLDVEPSVRARDSREEAAILLPDGISEQMVSYRPLSMLGEMK